MSDKLNKDSGESTISRYTQQNTPISEGSKSRKSGPSFNKVLPDDSVVYNSAGKEVDEILTGDPNIPNLKKQRQTGEYGKVKVIMETQAGHVILVDETPGNERFFMLHPNGTYTNIEPSRKIDKVEGELMTLISNAWKIEVEKDRLTFIHGNDIITIDKNRSITVSQNNTENVEQNEIISIGQNRTKTVNENEDDVIKGEWNITVDGNTNLTCKKDVTITAKNIHLN